MTEVGDTWATTAFGPKPTPHVFVQWKGTDVCLDFNCACGYHGHYDGDFAYDLRCEGCGRVWTMPHTFGLIEGGDEEWAQPTSIPHLDRSATSDQGDRSAPSEE